LAAFFYCGLEKLEQRRNMSFCWTTFQRCSYGTAILMTNYYKQGNMEMFRPVFKTCQFGVHGDVPCDSHDEQVSEALIENDLWGHARIRTTQNLGVWMLARGQFFLPSCTLMRMLMPMVSVARIAGLQFSERGSRGNILLLLSADARICSKTQYNDPD